jgi:hypothetical protein
MIRTKEFEPIYEFVICHCSQFYYKQSTRNHHGTESRSTTVADTTTSNSIEVYRNTTVRVPTRVRKTTGTTIQIPLQTCQETHLRHHHLLLDIRISGTNSASQTTTRAYIKAMRKQAKRREHQLEQESFQVLMERNRILEERLAERTHTTVQQLPTTLYPSQAKIQSIDFDSSSIISLGFFFF